VPSRRKFHAVKVLLTYAIKPDMLGASTEAKVAKNKKTSKKASKSNPKRSKKPVIKATPKATKPSEKTRKPTKKTAAKASKAAKPAPKFKSPYPRAEGNPYRPNSSYATAVDILAGHSEDGGMTRQALIEELAKVTAKPVKNCGFDVDVVISAKNSPTGPRHQSARDGYWVQREGDFCKLRTA
jgi:hypothetical protein